jgi:hypothetical protein
MFITMGFPPASEIKIRFRPHNRFPRLIQAGPSCLESSEGKIVTHYFVSGGRLLAFRWALVLCVGIPQLSPHDVPEAKPITERLYGDLVPN